MSIRIDMGSLLERQARDRASRPFVKMVEDTEWMTYGEFNKRANRLAHGMLAVGVTKGDYVCVVLENCVDYLTISYALKKIGAIEVSVNIEFKGVGLTRLLNVTGAKIVVTQATFVGPISEIQHDLEHVTTFIFVDDTDESGTVLQGYELLPLSEVISNCSDNPPRQVIDTDIAQIQFTSGTTGLSKGLLSPHRHAIRKAEGVAAACQITEDDCSYTPWPLFHSGAAHHEILTVIYTGSRVVLRKRFSASRFWDEVRANGATWFMVVGSVEAILCAPPPSPSDKDNPVRVAFGCPYPVPRKVFEERFGLKTIDCYGLEDCGLVSSTRLNDGDYESQGRVRDIYDIRIGDENDDPQPVGKAGQILIRPLEPFTVLQGYFGIPETTLQSFGNLWFHTGDLGKFDAAGRLYFLGRLKQVIRRRGENVMPREVEEVIHIHPAVEECVAVGVPSPVGEEDVKVYLVLRSGHNLSAEELRAFCRKRMAHFQVPEHVEFVDTIPRTPTGKPALSKLHWRDSWNEG